MSHVFILQQGVLQCYLQPETGWVPGCLGFADAGIHFCYEAINTYSPGALAVPQNGLLLSIGLTSRIIATKLEKVQYDIGGVSTESFHSNPDGRFYMSHF